MRPSPTAFFFCVLLGWPIPQAQGQTVEAAAGRADSIALSPPMSPAAALGLQTYLGSAQGAALLSANPGLNTVLHLDCSAPGPLQALGPLNAGFAARAPEAFFKSALAAKSQEESRVFADQFTRVYRASEKTALLEFDSRARRAVAEGARVDSLEAASRDLAPYALYGQAAAERVRVLAVAASSARAGESARDIASRLLATLRGLEDSSAATAAGPRSGYAALHAFLRPASNGAAGERAGADAGSVPAPQKNASAAAESPRKFGFDAVNRRLRNAIREYVEPSPNSLLGRFIGSDGHRMAMDVAEHRAEEWVNTQKCVSCHSVLPYVIARTAAPNERGSAPDVIRDYLTGRLDAWAVRSPWYDEQAQASDSTELILSSFMLSRMERSLPAGTSDHAARAVGLLTKYQESDGSFPWLDFNLQPLESKEAKPFGSSLAAMAMAALPEAEKARYGGHISRLTAYLRTEWGAARTSDFSRLTIAWAGHSVPGLADPAEIAGMLSSVAAKQARNGGWSIGDLSSSSGRSGKVDAFATAYVLFVMKETGLYRSAAFRDAYGKGVRWLKTNQRAAGDWGTVSTNRNEPFNNSLATDMATGFAAAVLGP